MSFSYEYYITVFLQSMFLIRTAFS